MKMDKVKARKQGDVVTVTLSKKFNIVEGQEFYITQEKMEQSRLFLKLEIILLMWEKKNLLMTMTNYPKDFSLREVN